mmetsp:Transcript_24379/g.62883  ORF Transcript_24379/g.62883 Transcript_24379/m.62883 type:complete len:255 (-) Transcript_24379:56-820(-)
MAVWLSTFLPPTTALPGIRAPRPSRVSEHIPSSLSAAPNALRWLAAPTGSEVVELGLVLFEGDGAHLGQVVVHCLPHRANTRRRIERGVHEGELLQRLGRSGLLEAIHVHPALPRLRLVVRQHEDLARAQIQFLQKGGIPADGLLLAAGVLGVEDEDGAHHAGEDGWPARLVLLVAARVPQLNTEADRVLSTALGSVCDLAVELEDAHARGGCVRFQVGLALKVGDLICKPRFTRLGGSDHDHLCAWVRHGPPP